MNPPRLIAFNKPYGVLSQFTDADGHPGLAHHIDVRGVYPAGRLDRDSEGLLLLTSDGQLQHQLSDPKHKAWKTYWVQVEGVATAEHAAQLSAGVILNDGPTKPAECKTMDAPNVWERNPPVRFRKSIPTSWLSISISEGRNRQVRRMTAAVGLPTLRLVRASIGNYTLDGLPPGQYRTLD
jgi:23S rRNA pseudouridine2457 synthase